MKRFLKIIIISFVCVIGAFSLTIGGVYLFGGFNEKIVYAENLSFSKSEKVSSERIFMQVNTTTEGVTRKKLKLSLVSGSNNDVIDFPEEVTIGETFTIIPKQVDGHNVGGNVSLIAYYDSTSAPVNAVARCNILIDIPIEKIELTNSNLTLRPNQELTICQKNYEIDTALNIYPENSLVPYKKSGSLNVSNLTDKAIFMELCSETGALSDRIAYFIDENGQKYNSNIIRIDYKFNEDGDLIFDNTIRIKAGNIQTDAFLKVFTYSTYDIQDDEIDDDGNVGLDEVTSTSYKKAFAVGEYIVDEMKIFENTVSTVTKEVYLYEDSKIYINNPDASSNDINLGVELFAKMSPEINVSKFYLRDYLFLSIDNKVNRSLSKADDSSDESPYGLNVFFDGISDQPSTWHWNFSIDSFQAYYKKVQSGTNFVATLTYKDDVGEQIVKEFYISPKIYEVDSLSVNYNSNSSFYVKSGDQLILRDSDIKINTSLPKNQRPTFSELAYYISYNQNYAAGDTLVSTLPTKIGTTYKATFSFSINQDSRFNFTFLSSEGSWCKRRSAVFTQTTSAGDILEYAISYDDKGDAVSGIKTQFEKNSTINAVVIFDLNRIPSQDVFFVINDQDTNINVNITSFGMKFYESTGNDLFSSFPQLTINNIRYLVDFDFCLDDENQRYLKINNNFVATDEYLLQGIGSFYITAQLIYTDESTGKVYWLKKDGNYLRTNALIEVYEELNSLTAYNYISDDSYNNPFGISGIEYDENDDTIHYIFITSDAMESLKNYVNYNGINISFYQDYNLSKEDYNGIDKINVDKSLSSEEPAITFGANWIPVVVSNATVGYRISYRVNPIHTIKINGTTLSNIFKIVISVDVNGVDVKAKFIMDNEDENVNTNSLAIGIIDKTLQSATIKYSSGVNGTSTNSIGSPKELIADIDVQKNFVWSSTNLDENFYYYFEYSGEDKEKTINSLDYEINVIDDSGIDLSSNLYSFQYKFDETEKSGKGGLSFSNFPAYYKSNGTKLVQEGILVELKIQSIGVRDFNSHYEWNGNEFIQTQNENLTASFYFKIFGLKIDIEKNTANDVYGCAGNEINLFGNNNALFKISVSSSASGAIQVTNDFDFSKIMNVEISSLDISSSSNLSKITINKDFMESKNVPIMFYVGSQANLISVKNGEDSSTISYQTIGSAYSIDLTDEFNSPSQNIKFADISYNKEGTDVPSIDDLIEVTISVVSNNLSSKIETSNLSSTYLVQNPISVVNNLLSFKTCSIQYDAEIKLFFRKKASITETFEKTYLITINPIYSQNDLVIGEKIGSDSYYSIYAGEENAANVENSKIQIKNQFNEDQSNVSSVVINLSDKDQSTKVPVLLHMISSYGNGDLSLMSYDLNYDKTVDAEIIFNFEDGGKFVFEKEFVVKHNIELSLNSANSTINSNGTILLTSSSIYNFTRIINMTTTSATLDLHDFDFEDESATYNKNSFEFDDEYFSDSLSGAQYILQLIKYHDGEDGESFKIVQSVITFHYNSGYNYLLDFDLEINLKLTILS